MLIKINDYEHLNEVILDSIEEINHWIEPKKEHYFIRYNGEVQEFKLVWENHNKYIAETLMNLEFNKKIIEKKNYMLQLSFTVNYDILNQEEHQIFYYFSIIDEIQLDSKKKEEDKNK